MKNIPKYITLLLSWLTISPLLLILDGRWKLLPKWIRLVLVLVSPLMAVVFVLGVVLGVNAYNSLCDLKLKYLYVRPLVIETITGVEMPKYKVVEQSLGPRVEVLVTLHECRSTLEFKEMPDTMFYNSLIDNGFVCRDNCYYYHRLMRGYGFNMTICEGDNRITVFVFELDPHRINT